MILEGIVTTVSPDGELNIAPMGPLVDQEMRRLVFRPFRSSCTYQNLKARGEGVLHVTDDVLLLAKAALGPVDPAPAVTAAVKVRGFILQDACRYYEFHVAGFDEREERVRIEAEVVHSGRLRDFFGFNRAKHAVVEAAILAIRTSFLPLDEMDAKFRELATLVEKTGGEQEHEAFNFLRRHLDSEMRRRKLNDYSQTGQKD